MEGEKNTAPTGITALISAALSARHNLPLRSNATSHTHGEHMYVCVCVGLSSVVFKTYYNLQKEKWHIYTE